MKKEIISKLTKNFEDYVNNENDIEFWYARDLQKLLGYSKWENFFKIVEKAKEACRSTGNVVLDHFPDVRKTIQMPKGATKKIQDIKLTRYACYLIT